MLAQDNRWHDTVGWNGIIEAILTSTADIGLIFRLNITSISFDERLRANSKSPLIRDLRPFRDHLHS